MSTRGLSVILVSQQRHGGGKTQTVLCKALQLRQGPGGEKYRKWSQNSWTLKKRQKNLSSTAGKRMLEWNCAKGLKNRWWAAELRQQRSAGRAVRLEAQGNKGTLGAVVQGSPHLLPSGTGHCCHWHKCSSYWIQALCTADALTLYPRCYMPCILQILSTLNTRYYRYHILQTPNTENVRYYILQILNVQDDNSYRYHLLQTVVILDSKYYRYHIPQTLNIIDSKHSSIIYYRY